MFLQERHTDQPKRSIQPGSLQQALREIGALNAILRSGNITGIATQEKGLITFFSVGAEQLLGYSGADVLDTLTLSDITDPREIRALARSLSLGTTMASFEALVSKAWRGIQDRSQVVFRHKDGHRVLASVSVTALLDDRGLILGYSIVGPDKASLKSDPRIQAPSDALVTIDTHGRITDLNRQMESLTGCTREEVIGVPFKNWFTEPERAEAVLQEKTVTEYELIARARDGQEKAVCVRATPFHDRQRRFDGVCAAARLR